MRLFIQASNVHAGGGKALLLPLLAALRHPATVLIDRRLDDLPDLHEQVSIRPVNPSLYGRLKAELYLRKQVSSSDLVLCFGNLPTIFASRGKVVVYVQNRYVIGGVPTTGLPWKLRLRLVMERLWIRAFLRDARIVVQTPAMARKVQEALGRSASVIPFAAGLPRVHSADDHRDYDYTYIASGEAHKNHRRLVEAWEIMASRGFRPSLCLTLNTRRDGELWDWVIARTKSAALSIAMEDISDPAAVAGLLARSRALIFPSLFESFGLPLIEAQEAGLPVIASERDFVRDVVAPVCTFDPESAISIARAVMRHQNCAEAPFAVLKPADFLDRMLAAD